MARKKGSMALAAGRELGSSEEKRKAAKEKARAKGAGAKPAMTEERRQEIARARREGAEEFRQKFREAYSRAKERGHEYPTLDDLRREGLRI